MNVRLLGIILFGLVAATGLLLWGTSIPLGVPGEWTWPRLPGTPETIVGTGGALIAGFLYLGFVLWGRRGINERTRGTTVGLIIALMAAGFVWLWTVQQTVPVPADLGKVPFVLYYPRSSGYFWQARYQVTDTAQFLSHYEELLAEQDYLHIGTHPPGLTLGYRGLLALCESSPRFCELVLATCPASVRDSFQTIATLSAQSGQTVTTADQAVIWLAALITLLAAAATTGEIYALVRRHFDASAAWTTAALWPLVPAIAVFHPKSDTLYPFLALGAAALWLTACDHRSLIRAFLAGGVMWLGMCLSLAFVTVGLLIAVMTAWEWWAGRELPEEDLARTATTWRQRTWLLSAGAAGFLLPTIALGVLSDVNLFNVWRWNLTNHALFYEHYTRTWWKWLLVNPLELAMSVGLPIAAMACYSVWHLAKQRTLTTGRAAVSAGFLLVWGLLWISGKNMGETARLWALLMPWVVMGAAPAIARGATALTQDLAGAESSWRGAVTPVALILAAQMIVCVLTVQRIDGFHFTELVQSQPVLSSE